jgi:hypothetical protein
VAGYLLLRRRLANNEDAYLIFPCGIIKNSKVTSEESEIQLLRTGRLRKKMAGLNAFRSNRVSDIVINVVMVSLCFLFFGFGGAKVTDRRDVGIGSVATPQMIYVTDFDLEVQDVKSGPGLLPQRKQPIGPRPNIGPRAHNAQKDPEVYASEIVELMATSLVKELTKKELNAQRFKTGGPLPANGLLVQGVFAQVDEGNRLHRVAIGFGAGETVMQIFVNVDDLVQGSPKPFYELDTKAESRKLPGAVITMNPYVAAAKYVLSGRDLEKNITQTASKIAADIAERVKK